MRKTLATVLNTLAGLGLVLCALRYLGTVWPLLLLNSMQTHAAFAIAMVMLASFVVTRSRTSLLFLVMSLALAGHSVLMKREFAIDATAADLAAGSSLRIISFNMLSENLEGATDVADMLMASNADVAVVLEGAPLFMQLQRLEAAYPYRLGCGERTPTCDLLMFSKHPMVDVSIGDLSDLRKDRVMSARISAPAGSFRMVAAHLSKPFFDNYHMKELDRLSAFMRNTTEPLILSGDFNSGTIAPDMQNMLRHLRLRTVPREPATWPVQLADTGFGVAIDHIYSRPPLVPLSVKRLDRDYGSNHYGLVADFAFRTP
ncbi:endonuclease/exonuclease/phosphatase family protein [Rhizobium sp. PP-CC-3G-465]|uniref:endonuclease/exonuclease/phosphatase family protein n=1 Tax=Rhizobium sp. PP-CC-3G-465 TaxID=2135648 RepID=UPI0010536C67|nr:endonuclease/exonuclease/phosphatase (EEP) superfamily protein YafD [Rhizobium sp. PP-CC-3G-465]